MRDRVRLGMVGGGQGAFIGAVHRAAAALDGMFDLCAGALSSDPERSRASGLAIGLSAQRSYGSWREMLDAERRLPEGDRVEVVAIVTPNYTHHEIARAFVDAGFHVVIDKPMTATVDQARDLVEAVERAGVVCAVTYTYSGYPMVRHARELVRSHAIGAVRRVCVEYHQGWLATDLESTGQKQASWRTDPALAGAGGAIGDIGTHAYNLAGFVTGLKAERLLAQLTSFVEGRPLDDDVQILLRYHGGARGMLWASQVAVGHENGLKLRVYGTKGGLEWVQADPNYLWFTRFGQPKQLITRGGAGAGPAAARATRVPSGHPEGYLEGFATIYAEAARAIRAAREGKQPDADVIYPTVRDGVDGMKFIAAAVASSKAGNVWTDLE